MTLNPQPSNGTGQLGSIWRDGVRPSAEASVTKRKNIPTPLYPAITSDKPLLRVGVMLDDWMVPAWVSEVLSSIQDSGVAELTTVILNREPRPARRTLAEQLKRVLSGQSAGLNTLLWDRYVRSDGRRNPDFAAPFHPTDVHSHLAGANALDVVPLCSGSVHRFNDADIAAVKRDGLDVIVRFGFNSLSGDILSAATYGVWSYQHGDNHKDRDGPAGFWEMYERKPLTAAILQILTEDVNDGRGGQVIYRSYGANQNFESLLQNRYWLFRKAIPFATRCLRRLYENGAAGIRSEAQTSAERPYHYRHPRNHHMLLFFTYVQWRHLIVRIQDRLKIQRDHWFLAIARGVAPSQQLTGKVTAVHPPRGRFWADPMIVRSKGQAFLFFEDYDYISRRAHISVAEIDADGRIGVPRIALQTEHHLSYPFVFEWHGTYYMIPETADVRAVRLYRAAEFPTRWEYVQDLLTDIEAVDATLCEHEGRWYLFTAVSEAGGSTWDELFLFVADTPMGPWAPHPMNPIVSDVRSARPGGALFRRNGMLYRPGQNSAKCYGHSLAVFEVTELTPDRYAERLAYRVEHDFLPNIYGCHTITMADDLIALDCKALKWRA